MRRPLILLAISLTGCLDAAATGNVTNLPAPTAAPGRNAELRRVFSTGLTASPRAASATNDRPTRSFARGRVELKVRKDGALEYHLNVFNPARETFTGAHIYRARPDGAAGPAVVALFSGAQLRDKYIQVRGMGVLVDPAGSAVMDELRANPAAFFVSLRSAQDPQGALRGTIH